VYEGDWALVHELCAGSHRSFRQVVRLKVGL